MIVLMKNIKDVAITLLHAEDFEKKYKENQVNFRYPYLRNYTYGGYSFQIWLVRWQYQLYIT